MDFIKWVGLAYPKNFIKSFCFPLTMSTPLKTFGPKYTFRELGLTIYHISNIVEI